MLEKFYYVPWLVGLLGFLIWINNTLRLQQKKFKRQTENDKLALGFQKFTQTEFPREINEVRNSDKTLEIFIESNEEENLLQKIANKTNKISNSIENYNSSFELSQELFCIINSLGYLIIINELWSSTLGYNKEELLAIPLIKLVHREDQEKTLEIFEKLLKEKQPLYFENRCQHKDGSYKWLAWKSLSSQDDNLIYAIAQDITGKKQVEVALKASEERLQRIISTISDGILVVDKQGKIRFLNQAAEQIFGRGKEELLDHDLGLPFVAQEIAEVSIIHPSGKLMMTEMRTAEISWEAESSYLISLRDITENYQIQQFLKESEKKYREMVETSAEGVWMLDKDGITTFVNLQMAQMLNYPVEEIINKKLFDFLDKEDIPKAKHYLKRRHEGIKEVHDFKFRRQDGSELWAIVSASPLFDDQENLTGILGMITDITDRKQIEQALRESEKKLDSILSSIQDVVWSINPENYQIIYINPACQQLTGYAVQDFLNDSNLWQKLLHPLDSKKIESYRNTSKDIERTECEYRIIRRDGEVRWINERKQLIYDHKGTILRIDGLATDITERKRAAELLWHNAFYDSLTDLPNRVLFMERLQQALDKVKNKQDYKFAVLFLDLDDFKIVNDSLGHLVGDELLQAIASRLQKNLRSHDILARLGGDEFTILLDDIENIEAGIRVAERIHQDFRQPFTVNFDQVFTNTSIGIALSNPEYQRPEDILRDADTALYRAKAQGKGRYAVFDQKMHTLALKRLMIENDLRKAIENNEFVAYYQPIFEIQTFKIVGFEALIRWQHPEKGLIPPSEFIPIAEETGLILPISKWILGESCRQLKTWIDKYHNLSFLKISVNLSGKELKEVDIIEQIAKILKDSGIEGNRVKLEITETLLIEDLDLARSLLEKFKELNIELCLDDFGTGYSSLSYLHRFPVDIIKIDRSFVTGTKLGSDNAEIVRTIITLAKILGMNVIAEGVETQEELEMLRTLDCGYGQGYLLSKPLPANAAEKLLKNNLFIKTIF